MLENSSTERFNSYRDYFEYIIRLIQTNLKFQNEV